MTDKPALPSRPLLPLVNVPLAAAGTLAVAASIVAVPGVAGWLGAGFALIMLAIAVIDQKRFLIPDPLNAAAFALGIVHCIVLAEGNAGTALVDAFVRAAVLALLFFALRVVYARLRGRQGIGLGDVKLAAVAGVWLDWPIMPIAIEIAALSALLTYGLRSWLLRRPLRPTSRLPFGLFFAPAIWISWLLQSTLMQGW
jgi:leader peptidase (prepilin peptidase)/N-methyltransferase